MNDHSISESDNDPTRVEKMLAEYERAQEIGHHTDTVIHEITAIVWGANTLLLGFILEVDRRSASRALIITSAFIGILMSIYVPMTMHWMKIGQRIAYSTCRQIESELPLLHRVNTKIHEEYPQWKPGQKMVWALTILFVLGWFYVIYVVSTSTHAPAAPPLPQVDV